MDIEYRTKDAYQRLMTTIHKYNLSSPQDDITLEALEQAGLTEQLQASLLRNPDTVVSYLKLYQHRPYTADNLFAGTPEERHKYLIDLPTKVCSVCDQALPKTDFNKSSTYDGLNSRCRNCRDKTGSFTQSKVDLIGMKIGKLTVLEKETNTYLTECECGVKRSIRTGELNRQRKNPKTTLACGQCGIAVLGKDLVGKHINHLQVLDFRKPKRGSNEVLVKCDCNTSEPFWIKQGDVRTNRRKACGEVKCNMTRNHRRTGNKSKHGEGRSDKLKTLRKRYDSMYMRCYNKNHESYSNYGAKGVTIGPEWSYDNPLGYQNYEKWFLEKEKEAIANNIVNPSVDRKDGSKGYSPENCRLVSKSTQSANRNHRVTNAKFNNIAPVLGTSGNVVSNKITMGFNHIVYTANITTTKIPKFLDMESLLVLHYIRATNELFENNINKIPFEIHIATIEETKQNAKYHIRKERTSTPDGKRYKVAVKHQLEDRYPSIGYRSVKLMNKGRVFISTVAYPVTVLDTIKLLNK